MNIIKEKINKKIFIGLISVILITAIYLILPVERANIDSMYVTNLDNNEKMIGLNDNVFVVKILKNRGPEKKNKIIVTNYEAEVLMNIKGNASKNIIVTQDAGYKNFKKTLVVPENLDLLKEGSIYILSTRSGGDVKYGLTSHRNTMIKIEEKDFKNNPKILEFKKAYINEIPYRNRESKNSFKNLSEEKKEKLKAEIVKIKREK